MGPEPTFGQFLFLNADTEIPQAGLFLMQLRNSLLVLTTACAIGLGPVASLAQWKPVVPGARPASPAAPAAPAVPVGDQAAALEERLIDLQVQVSTLRSLARSVAPVATGGSAGQPFRAVMSDATAAQQIQALESEARSVGQQIKQLTGVAPLILATSTRARVPAVDGRAPQQPPTFGQVSPGNAGGGVVPLTPQGAVPQGVNPQATLQPDTSGGARIGGWAGTTTVVPGNAPTVGQAPGTRQPVAGGTGEILPGTVYPGYKPSVPAQQAPAVGNRFAAVPQPLASEEAVRLAPVQDAETAYQTAYGYLLQQDYGAAQVAFKEFLERYPKTPLAGNAQYWLGETHYVRGAYKNAAVAFLKGYETYGDGNKGADSLLKLGMSLGKLRQNSAACSSLGELAKRYRNAPETTLQRAQAEMDKLRCPK